jgi:hypothetical protein
MRSPLAPLAPLAALSLLAAPAAPQAAAPQSLYFVMNDDGTTADLGVVADQPASALGQLYDTTIVRFVPGTDTSAVKVTGLPEWACLLGDADGDFDFWEALFDDVDALGLNVLLPPPDRLTSRNLILSSEAAFGNAMESISQDLAGACDGTLFTLLRKPDGTNFLVDPFLREITVLSAIGQLGTSGSDGVDVDAFALDALGNVYLSFRVDEDVNGVLLADDGVVCLPSHELIYDWPYRVLDATYGSALIVLDAAGVNTLVAHAGLLGASGQAIQSLTDLQALEIDPAGGSFVPLQPAPWLPDVPNLLFNGQAIGPTVLTTADGGRIATLNGQPLGSVTLSGASLGLDAASTSGATSDLNALLVVADGPPCPLVDVGAGEVDVHVPGAVLEFLAGNLTPEAPALLLVDSTVPQGGGGFASVPLPLGLLYPDYFLSSPPFVLALFTDAHGRLRVTGPVGPPPPISFVVLAQAADLVRKEVSSPALIWCP